MTNILNKDMITLQSYINIKLIKKKTCYKNKEKDDFYKYLYFHIDSM